MNWLTKKVNLNIKTTLGMFNLAKGVLILLVIMSHAFSFNKFWDQAFFWETIPGFFLRMNSEVLSFAVISSFFMICGYGFRKVSLKKSVIQLKVPMIMYVCTAIATILGRMIQLTINQRNQFDSPAVDMLSEVLAYLLGMSPETSSFFGLPVETVGIVWFVVTYMVASIFLNAVLMIRQEKLQWVVVSLLGILGVLLSHLTIPFCLLQSMVGCGYMFVGYQMKKKKIFQKEIPLGVIFMLVVVWLVSIKGGGMNLAKNGWYRGLPDLLSSYAAGLVFTVLLVKLDRIKGWLSDRIRWIGNNSLMICCIHTLSHKMVGWFVIRDGSQDALLAKVMLHMVFHCVFCFGFCFLILQIMKKRSEMRGNKE